MRIKSMLYAEFFQQQYVQGNDIDLLEILSDCGDNAFDIEIQEEDVRKALMAINVNKSEGPDGISPKLLKNCAHSLSKPLAVLFRKSLVDGYVPAMLKNSHCEKLQGSVGNYRAVVIVPTIAIIFEMVMYNKMHEFVHRKISQKQHGFVEGRSTATNLLEMVNYTMDGMIAKCQTDVLYTDFEKAFDRVNHKRMLHKMSRFGFGKRLVKWFYAYLTTRRQFAHIG